MLVELAILGAVASLLVQWLKQGGNSKLHTLTILVVVSFVLAVGVWALQQYNLWAWFLGIVATANTIYAFVLQHVETGYRE